MRNTAFIIILLGLIVLSIYGPSQAPPVQTQERKTIPPIPAPDMDVFESYRREIQALPGDLPRLSPRVLDLFYQSMRGDAELSRRQRIDLLLEQLAQFEPGSDEWVATLYTLASEVPLEQLQDLMRMYRSATDESSRDLLLQVMRIALQEPMISSLAKSYPQGPDALYLLVRHQAQVFQAFLAEEGLHQAEPGLFADVLWTRAMTMPADQGLEVVAQSFIDASDSKLATHLARIYSDILFEDLSLTPLLLQRALNEVSLADKIITDALAMEWRDRLRRGDLSAYPELQLKLQAWLARYQSARE